MKKNTPRLILVAALFVAPLVACVVLAAPWAEPTAAPPGGNVESPVNVSSTAQSKNGDLTVTGNFRAGGELRSTMSSGYGQLRMVYGSYGAMFRNDGSATYMLLTNSGDQYGQWNGLRPFTVNNASGLVSLGSILHIENGGQVGIGDSNPTYPLTIAGTGGVIGLDNQSSLTAKNSAGTYETWMWPRWSDNVMYTNYGSAGWNIRNNSSTNTMFLTNGGNVGIGTISPGSKLDVQGAFAANFGTTSQCCGGTNPTLSLAEATSVNNRLPWIQFHTSGFQEAFIRLAKDARVFEFGDNQSAGASIALLNGSGTRNIYLNPSGGAYGLGSMRIGSQTFNSNSNGWLYMGNSSYSVYGGQGLAADYLWANSASYAAAFYYTSDAKLKENVAPLSDSLEKITRLDGVSFNWKESGEPSIGLIAQDVEKIFPEVVTNNTASGYKSVDYGKLVAPMIEALKEQQQQIKDLKLRVEELEAAVIAQ